MAKRTSAKRTRARRASAKRTSAKRTRKAAKTTVAQGQHLLSRGLETIDHYIDLCQALISDLTRGTVTKREALQSIRKANKWLLARSQKAGW
jgi:hypothetical protein